MAAWGSGYKYAYTKILPESGQFASLATKNATDPAQIYFKASSDGTTWPVDGDAVLAASISGSGVSAVCTFTTDGKGRFLLTNGVDVFRVSDDGGITWSDL